MLVHQSHIPAVPGEPNFPTSATYLQFTDSLIETYGSFDFRWSWKSYDKETLFNVRKVFWEKTPGTEPSWYALPEIVWDLFARTIWDDLIDRIRADVEEDESPSGARSAISYRMKRVNHYRTAFRWLQLVDKYVEQSKAVPDEWLVSIDAHPEFISFLIQQVEQAMPKNWEEHRFLLPPDELTLVNALNALKVQLPSKHPQYLVPSQLLQLELAEMKAIQRRWAYRVQELQEQQEQLPEG